MRQTCPHSSIIHHLWPFLIFTLTPSHLPSPLPPPINRAFQTKREGVRVEKEKKIRPVRLKWLSGHLEFHTPAAIQFSNSPLILAAVMIAKAPLPDFDHDIPLCFWRVATTISFAFSTLLLVMRKFSSRRSAYQVTFGDFLFRYSFNSVTLLAFLMFAGLSDSRYLMALSILPVHKIDTRCCLISALSSFEPFKHMLKSSLHFFLR